MLIFSTLIINKLKGEIENLEIDLNYYHNIDTISPSDKINKVLELLENIARKQQILDLYTNYIVNSNNSEND